MKIDTGIYPPEIVAKDILSSFSEKDIDTIIDVLTEGRKSMSNDSISQGVFSWGEEVGEKWDLNGERQQTEKMTGEKS